MPKAASAAVKRPFRRSEGAATSSARLPKESQPVLSQIKEEKKSCQSSQRSTQIEI